MAKPFSSLLACCVLLIISGTSAVRAGDLDRFIEELRAVSNKYQSWSATVTAQHYRVEGTLPDVQRDPFSRRPAEVNFSAVRLVQAGEKFRYDEETLHGLTSLYRSAISWDGQIARERTSNYANNFPTLEFGSARFPHTLVLDEFVDGLALLDRLFLHCDETLAGLFDGVEIESINQTMLDAHACWKVQTRLDQYGRADTIWFSQDHDLLPIRLELFVNGQQTGLFLIDSFQQAANTEGVSRWFPQRCVYLLDQEDTVDVHVVTLKVRQDETDPDVFSAIDLSRPAMLADQLAQAQAAQAAQAQAAQAQAQAAQAQAQLAQAPVPVAAAPSPVAAETPPSWLTKIPPWLAGIAGSMILIPGLILLWLGLRQRRVIDQRELTPWHRVRNIAFVFFASTTTALFVGQWAEPRLWVYIVPMLLLVVPLTWVLWRRAESTDRATPQYRVRTIAGICGGMLTLSIFIALCFVPTWWQHGIAAAIAGIVGLLWIAGMQCFIRCRRISIMTVLSLATCLAMIMSGYQGATQQIRARQRMMDALDDFGGSYDERSVIEYGDTWGNTPEGLLLHRQAALALGPATFTEIKRVSIPSELFTARNLRTWNLNDVRSIQIVPPTDRETYRVSAAAIQAIRSTCPLGVLTCELGVLDEEALRALSRFPKLHHLAFDLDGEPIPASLPELRSLRSLELSHADIDRVNTQRLAEMLPLKYLTLRQFRLRPDALDASDYPAAGTIVLDTMMVTPKTISWINQRPPVAVQLWRCTFANDFSLGGNPLDTTTAEIYESSMTDQDLLSLVDSRRLSKIELIRTRVTHRGMDQFSKQRPDVAITLE